jgi:hypothetical protein
MWNLLNLSYQAADLRQLLRWTTGGMAAARVVARLVVEPANRSFYTGEGEDTMNRRESGGKGNHIHEASP